MTALADTPVLHPLQPVAACLEAVGEALASAPSGPLPTGDAETLAVLVTEATRSERMMRELRLRLARAA